MTRREIKRLNRNRAIGWFLLGQKLIGLNKMSLRFGSRFINSYFYLAIIITNSLANIMVFVRFTLISACIFVLLGVLASLLLSALLFSMGMKEVLFDAVQAWAGYSPVGLVSSAVGALDRFLLGMVCLVFGLGSFELFLARSNRAGQVRDRRLKKLAWLKVSSIDDLEQKVGEIIVAVMVVNLHRGAGGSEGVAERL